MKKLSIVLTIFITLCCGLNASATEKKSSKKNMMIPAEKSKKIQTQRDTRAFRTVDQNTVNSDHPVSSPAIKTPGLNPRMLKDQNAARAAREMKQLERLRAAQQAMQLGNQARGAGSGTGIGAHDADSLRNRATNGNAAGSGYGSGATYHGINSGATDAQKVHQSGVIDYRENMRHSASQSGRGHFSSGPTARPDNMTIGDRSAAMSGNYTKNNAHKGSSSTIVDSDGNKHTTTTIEGKDKNTHTTVDIRRADGASRRYETEHRADGSSTTRMVERDNKGNVTQKTVVQTDSEDNVIKRSTNSQPTESGSSAKSDGCNWNPVWGRCMKQTNTTHQEMTGQPGPGQQDSESGSGGASRPRLGNEAVTNPGDSNWSVSHGGSGGGGHPIDMRDPSHGGDGESGVVPRGGFAPH